ncbi:MAG: hypothetical protein VB934_09445 [Polyangiaceae bacterium]
MFDVGANIGIFSVRAVQRGSEGGRLRARAGHLRGMAYYPNSPALSTAHPDFWDANPRMLREAVEGSTRNAPPSLYHAKLLPRFLSRFIARHLRRGAETIRCQLRTISAAVPHEVGDEGYDELCSLADSPNCSSSSDSEYGLCR